MNTITFTKLKDPDNIYDVTNVTIELESENRQEVIESFIEFLGACGYQVEDLKEMLF